jgi:hypothetical protein
LARSTWNSSKLSLLRNSEAARARRGRAFLELAWRNCARGGAFAPLARRSGESRRDACCALGRVGRAVVATDPRLPRAGRCGGTRTEILEAIEEPTRRRRCGGRRGFDLHRGSQSSQRGRYQFQLPSMRPLPAGNRRPMTNAWSRSRGGLSDSP